MSQGPSPPPPSWQTPCLPSGPRVRVPPVPQHCHPLSPPRCKAEHWDGQSSLGPASAGSWAPRHRLGGSRTASPCGRSQSSTGCGTFCGLRGAREVSEQQNKGLVSPCKRLCVQYRHGPAAGMPWGPSGRMLARPSSICPRPANIWCAPMLLRGAFLNSPERHPSDKPCSELVSRRAHHAAPGVRLSVPSPSCPSTPSHSVCKWCYLSQLPPPPRPPAALHPHSFHP